MISPGPSLISEALVAQRPTQSLLDPSLKTILDDSSEGVLVVNVTTSRLLPTTLSTAGRRKRACHSGHRNLLPRPFRPAPALHPGPEGHILVAHDEGFRRGVDLVELSTAGEAMRTRVTIGIALHRPRTGACASLAAQPGG